MEQGKNQVEIKQLEAGTAHYWRWRFGTFEKAIYVTVLREDGTEARPKCVLSNHRLTEEEMAEAFNETTAIA